VSPLHKQQRILILIDFYLPGYRAGGPTRTTANLVEWLGDDFDFRILTRDRDMGETVPYADRTPNTWHQVGKAQVRYLTPNQLNWNMLHELLRTVEYDVLYLNTVFSTLTVICLMLDRLRQLPDKPIVVAGRGNLSVGAMNIKSTKKWFYLLPARLLGLYDRVNWHATSEEEVADITRVFGRHHSVRVQQIPNLPTRGMQSENISLGRKYPGTAHIIFLARISRMKNVEFFLESMRSVEGQLKVDMWGPIEDESYWNRCRQIIETLPASVRVEYRGAVSPEKIADTLAGYHLFYLPTLSENFGHVILEALCAGCPILISDRTPWRGLQEHGIGWDLPLEEPARFTKALQTVVDADELTLHAMAQAARAYGIAYIQQTDSIRNTRNFLLDLVQNSG